MTRWQDAAGGRIWWDPDDIDALGEDQLMRAGMYPYMDNPFVDIERFIEQYLGAELDQFADVGSRLYGQTEFFVARPPLIQISRSLSEQAEDEKGSARFVVRSTMGHEAAHVIMHSLLFAPSYAQPTLPNTDTGVSRGRLLRCPEASFRAEQGRWDWREVQANKGMAALLMPKEFFRDVVEEAFDEANIPRANQHLKHPKVGPIVARVSEMMLVSKLAVSIRMEELGLLVLPGQEEFAFRDQEDEDDSF